MPEHFKGLFNKLLLLVIIGGTLLVPIYIGAAVGFVTTHRYIYTMFFELFLIL